MNEITAEQPQILFADRSRRDGRIRRLGGSLIAPPRSTLASLRNAFNAVRRSLTS